jgi:hypothetical protein
VPFSVDVLILIVATGALLVPSRKPTSWASCRTVSIRAFHKVWLPRVSFSERSIKLMVVMVELEVTIGFLDVFGGGGSWYHVRIIDTQEPRA